MSLFAEFKAEIDNAIDRCLKESTNKNKIIYSEKWVEYDPSEHKKFNDLINYDVLQILLNNAKYEPLYQMDANEEGEHLLLHLCKLSQNYYHAVNNHFHYIITNLILTKKMNINIICSDDIIRRIISIKCRADITKYMALYDDHELSLLWTNVSDNTTIKINLVNNIHYTLLFKCIYYYNYDLADIILTYYNHNNISCYNISSAHNISYYIIYSEKQHELIKAINEHEILLVWCNSLRGQWILSCVLCK